MHRIKDNLVLIVILVVGALLRFWDLFGMDYHHDELSALLRTRFDAFDSLIQHGVWVDGHPAFPQVFLWIWTTMFGYSPWCVKLPFIAAGCLSLVVFYESIRWMLNRNAALVASAWFAVAQYTILYSQWARPYAFGMLFMLLGIYFLVRYRRESSRLLLLGFSLTAALTAYSHYFALLQLILFSGLWFALRCNRRQRIELLVAGLVAFIFWLPHLRITLHHLEIGGIGDWLKPPQPDFWQDLLAYAFNHSWLLAVVLLTGILFLFLSPNRGKKPWKTAVLLLVALVMQYEIAYWYSVKVSALMHLGTMFFTFPILAMFVGTWFKNVGFYYSRVVVLGVLILGSLSLIDREHFQLNYKTEFMDPFILHEAMELKSDASLTTVFDLRPDAVGFLHDLELIDSTDVDIMELWPNKWKKGYLRDAQAQRLMHVTTAATVPEWRAQALFYFPMIEERRFYNTSTCEVLRKGTFPEDVKRLIHREDEDLSGKEHALAMEVEPALSDSTFYVFRIEWSEEGKEAQLVMDWKANDGNTMWRSVHIDQFGSGAYKNHASIAVDVRDLKGLESGGKLKVYLWNPTKGPLALHWMAMECWPSNPLRYGLFQHF